MTDWTWVGEDSVMDAVDTFARSWAGRFGSESDARHEAMAFIAEHPRLIAPAKGSSYATAGSRLIYLRLTKDLAQRKVKDETDESVVPAVVEDEPESALEAVPGPYEMASVARLAVACYTLECVESYRDPFGENLRPVVSRFTKADPSHAHTLWAAVADLRNAYCRDGGRRVNRANLSKREEVSFYCRYALDMPARRVAMYGGRFDIAERALMKITNVMNGAS